MNKQALWLGILGFVATLALYYTYQVAGPLYQYYTLDTQTPAQSVSFAVEKTNIDAYALKASYSFTYQGIDYAGTDELLEKYYPESKAYQAQDEAEKAAWMVWLQASAPKNNALERLFPTKDFIYMLIVWGILIYFAILGFWLRKSLDAQ